MLLCIGAAGPGVGESGGCDPLPAQSSMSDAQKSPTMSLLFPPGPRDVLVGAATK